MDTAGTAPDRASPAPVPEGPLHGNGRSKGRFRLGNRPPLTGIRAFLIVVILAYHSNFRAFPGVWVAVQVFFVLSGFLITAGLAVESDRTGHISLRTFYARRAARLLPPLALTVALIAIYAGVVHVADAGSRVWGDIAATVFYYADYRQALGHSPFFGFLAQTWSLSVEEQFYLVWSILMAVAVIAHRRRFAYALGAAGFLASTASRLWIVLGATHFDHAVFSRVYYAFDTRADALFLGSLLGLAAADGRLDGWGVRPRRMAAGSALVSVAVIVWAAFEVPLWTRVLALWWFPIGSVAAGLVIVHFIVNPAGISSRAVGTGVLVYFGNLSYTLYLVNWPIYLAIAPSETHWGYWPTEIARLTVSIAIASASWFALERPLARWRRRALDRTASA